MSMPEDNPFKRTPSDSVTFDGPPQKSSKKGWMIGCGLVGLLGLLICCGGAAYLGIKGPAMLTGVMNEAMVGPLTEQLTNEPSVQDQIGEIQSLEFDLTQTMENAQKAGEAGQDPKIAFRIQGTNGSGVVLIQQDASGPGGAGIKSGTLIMDDGTEYPLDVGAIKAGPPGNLQINLDDVIDDGQAEVTDGPLEIGPIELNPADQ